MKIRIPFLSTPRRIEDGIRIVSRSAAGTVIENRSGNVLFTRLVPAGGSISTESVLDGSRSMLKISLGDGDAWVQNFRSEQECNEASQTLNKSLRTSTYSMKSFLISVAVALVVVFLITPPADQAAAAVAALPDRPAYNPGAAFTPKTEPASAAGSVLSETEKADLAEAVAKRGLKLTAGAKQFVVFSDPNCPFCRELEQSLVKLDKSFAPVVLPLGFKPGARDLAASILCSKDPAKAWRETLLDGKAPSASACDAGFAQVDQNMALFQLLKMGSTPTMVTPGGSVVIGTGTPEVIASVMGK